MTFTNEAAWDRSLRMVLGLFLIAVWWTMASRASAWLPGVAGAVLLVAGVVRWCPAWTGALQTTRFASNRRRPDRKRPIPARGDQHLVQRPFPDADYSLQEVGRLSSLTSRTARIRVRGTYNVVQPIPRHATARDFERRFNGKADPVLPGSAVFDRLSVLPQQLWGMGVVEALRSPLAPPGVGLGHRPLKTKRRNDSRPVPTLIPPVVLRRGPTGPPTGRAPHRWPGNRAQARRSRPRT
jgi:Protein of unknown function (DUF2892)